MSYRNGNIEIKISSIKNLIGCNLKLYSFNFLTGEYDRRELIDQAITEYVAKIDGVYQFTYPVPNQGKFKCLITQGQEVLASREQYIGEKHEIKIETKLSEIGILYKVKANISISNKLLFYKSGASSININLPQDLIAREELIFKIEAKNFKPEFKINPLVEECFTIHEKI